MGSCSKIESLPLDCISEILSRASPLEACLCSLLSSTLRSCADSDMVWRSFLPSDHEVIVSSAVNPFSLNFSSYKLLFYSLCQPLLIHHGNKIFRLEKCSGKKSFIISARELAIAWSSHPMMWCWKQLPESRFAEVVELRTVSWLEIEGKMRTQNLTPNTKYAAYLIMKVCDGAFGVEFVPSKVSVTIGKKVQRGRAYLGCKDEKKCKMESLFYGNRREVMGKAAFGEEDEVISIPWKREDGWMEIELGEFFIDEADEEITMNLREVSYQLKGGIIIEGIEIRPKHAP
ncbi:Phloem protein 2-like [Vigna unguiculata]|uniref:Phloem protein 2-like n=1 Tax=Vigna unguiculata TaxID=3917 RepID=A0A4D6KVU0_VIGUN|nr:Phloem protein 2-like [Vigna unguiculata]